MTMVPAPLDTLSPSPLTCLLLTVRREVHKSVVSKRATLRTSKMVSTLNFATTPAASMISHQEALALSQEFTDPNPFATTSPPTPTVTTTPTSYPPLSLRLRAATTLARIYIRTPIRLFFQSINTTSTCSYIYPGYSSPAPIPQILSTARVSSPSRPPAAVLPMSTPDPPQAQTSATTPSSSRTR